MPKVNIDPDEVYRFATTLRDVAEHVKAERAQLVAEFNTLSTTWHDAKYQSYRDEFAKTMRRLQAFIDKAELYERYLRNKAARAEDYLQQDRPYRTD